MGLAGKYIDKTIKYAVVLVLMLALLGASGVALADPPRVPMHRQKSAKPRLMLRLMRAKLKPHGTASVAATRPMAPLSRQALVRVEDLAARHLKVAEGLVRKAYGRGINGAKRGGLLDQAASHFARWEGGVRQLVKGRHLSSPVYKEWARKTWEAQMVQVHAAVKLDRPDLDPARALAAPRSGTVKGMLAKMNQQPRARIKRAVVQAWTGLYGGARPAGERDLLRLNPLALLTRKVPRPAAAAPASTVTYRTQRNPLSPKTWRRKSYKVRTDLAFVWVPGVARTYTEFERQKETLLKNGVLALHANTGSWRNPYANAYDVAEAINKARKITGNPNVKVVLVGYSQGNTSSYAFMQAQGRNPREKAMFSELRKNVVQVHDMNSAARGTPMADLGVKLVKLLTSRTGDAKSVDHTLKQTAHFLDVRSSRVKRKVASFVVRHREKLGRFLRLINGRVKNGGKLDRIRAKISGGIHNMLVGGLESLTTYRGKEVMENPRVRAEMRHVPVFNTVGVVPRSRPDLVPTVEPLDQRPGWRYMLDKKLANDYQVPEQHQRLAPVLKGAVDLPTQAIGHWGIAGVNINAGKVVHDEGNYRNFSPEAHTLTMLRMVQRMGL